VAVVADGERCTHGDLLRRTALFAHALRKAASGEGYRVGVYLEKSLDAVVSIFAVAQAGAACQHESALKTPGRPHHAQLRYAMLVSSSAN